MKEYKKFVRAFFLWPPLGLNGSAICNAKNSNNSSQYGGNSPQKVGHYYKQLKETTGLQQKIINLPLH